MGEEEGTSFAEEPATSGRYSGSAWRARFLRAPKVALELAARADFVPLSDLAIVKLGLKTGADDFFFVERVDGDEAGALAATRGLVVVRGQNGWRGQVALTDLVPAILNPHQLYNGQFRYLTVPKAARHFLPLSQVGPIAFGASGIHPIGRAPWHPFGPAGAEQRQRAWLVSSGAHDDHQSLGLAL